LPDLNVWLALSWADHRHSPAAWDWFSSLKSTDPIGFCRFSQFGMLRLLTTSAIMGKDVLTIDEAWKVYDRWLQDARVGMRGEPAGFDGILRASTRPVAKLASPKALGDCYLIAASQSLDATLVTFDKALAAACHTMNLPATLLDRPRLLR
jgi:toxin-antitoxin system PIN domain toxin